MKILYCWRCKTEVPMLDEEEFLSPYGIRSLSKYHQNKPFYLEEAGETHCVSYEPGESKTWLFGGNSNWRGPVWFPINYLLIEALQRYHYFYCIFIQTQLNPITEAFVNFLKTNTTIFYWTHVDQF